MAFPRISFYQKIILGHLAVFLVMFVSVFPFASYSVTTITKRALLERAEFLISKVKSAPTEEALVRRVRDQKNLVFFRVGLIGPKKNVLYDSATSKLLGPSFDPNYVIDHKEVNDAFDTGYGYHEDYSSMLGQEMAYLARSFSFHGKTYVLRTAFPMSYISNLRRDYEIGILLLVTILLTLSSFLTYLFITYLTSPIRTIVEKITPYQRGLTDKIPMIHLGDTQAGTDLGHLADTLNSLSERVERQIQTLKEERNERGTILDSLNEGIIAVEPDLTISYTNYTARDLLSMRSDELLSHPFSVTEQSVCEKLLKRCQESGEVEMEMLTIENHRKVHLNAVAISRERGQGAILVLQDLSSQYELMEMSRDFVANASHELKTPITVIQGWAETLRDNLDLPKEQVAEIYDKIARNCQRMAQLVKDLLELAEIENISESKLADCDIPQILDECYQLLMTVSPDTTCEVIEETSGPFVVEGDPALLERALFNLYSNAAKYSPDAGKITVNLSDDEDNVTVRVADQGLGIPPADLERIFLKFYTVDKARSRKMGGTGLGLSIVQTIIQKHRGKIDVESEVGKGTAFTIVLPKKRIL